jgi:hypothetical protein
MGTTLVRVPCTASVGRPSPNSRASSSCTIFTICWPGETAFRTAPPITLLHALEEVACDLEVHVGLEQHTAHFAEPVLDHGLREQGDWRRKGWCR